MAKLSPAQMNAITQVHGGETLTARKNTLDSLVRDDYLAMYTTGYVLTDKAYALGFERPSQKTNSVDEITELLDSNPWDNVTEHATIGDALDHLSTEKWSRTKNAITDLASQASKNLERPFVVREWVATRWVVIPDTRSITWGTANVKRNRLKAQGRTVHVLNIQTQEVWA